MKAVTKTRGVGGSLIATIPKEIVEAIGLKENEIVEIDVKKIKKHFFGTSKGIGSFTKKDRLETRW